jgi:DNA-binding HxlR family transcriptional regulator
MGHTSVIGRGDSEVADNVQELGPKYVQQISRVLELLRGKWTVHILCAMREHPIRLGELRRMIPSASKKALTASLRSLEASGVVLRRDLSSSVLRVEYEIIPTIREPLSALLDQLAEWNRSYGSNDDPRGSKKVPFRRSIARASDSPVPRDGKSLLL